MNIRETAVEFINEYKEKLRNENEIHYVNKELYIAIDSNKDIIVSMCSNILESAIEAIVILVRKELAYKNYYLWYDVYHIINTGEVIKNYSDGEFSISTYTCGGFSYHYMNLSYKKREIYSFLINISTWNTQFNILWNLFSMVRKYKTEDEVMMAVDIFKTNMKLLDSKKEIETLQNSLNLKEYQLKEYRNILDEFKILINKLNQ